MRTLRVGLLRLLSGILINKIKSKFQTEERKRLLSNFFSLSVLQIVNYILPLLVVPYLFTTLGAEKFGLIAFAQAVVIYFGLLVNYGFNLSATKGISIHRNDAKKVSEIYSSVTIIKLIFSIIAFGIFAIMVFNVDIFMEDWKLYLLTFGTIVESILFPVWFFQGMERMKYITVIYTISKIVVTAMIFIIIKSSDDYLMVPILYFIGSITSGILSVYALIKLFKINFIIPTLNQIIFQLKDGRHLFISNLSINMYRNANVLILGLMSTTLYVGYYALAEKIIKAVQSLMGPVGEAIYPYIANKSANQTLQKSLNDIFKIAKYYSIILSLIFISILALAPFIIYILSGSYIENAILDIRILSVVIVFGGLNYLFGIIGLINLGYKKYFMKSVFFAGMFNIILCFLLSPALQDIGAAISLSISEFILLLLLAKKMFALYKEEESIR
jgi:polysaccharide transporter, PST family